MFRRSLAQRGGNVLADPDRLRVLERTGLMDADPEAQLDRWGAVAAEALGASVALVAMVGGDRLVIASSSGRAGWTSDEGILGLTRAFCRHVIADGAPLTTRDARHHAAPRVAGDVGAVAYAGAPIVVCEQAIGVLCVVEPEARTFSDADLRLLDRLAEGLASELELRIATTDLARCTALSESRVRVQEDGFAVERRETHDRLVFDATHDALTGLLNRATAFDRLEQILARDAATRGPVSVLSVDLDRLKAINDGLGHETGDQVIARSARRLRDCAGADDVVARLGGEEFLIVCAGDAVDLARSALAALRVPLLGLPNGQEVTVTGSVGIATIDGARGDARQATRRADTAMYVAKARGGDQYAICDHADAAPPIRRLMIESALRHAIERGELSVVYQPLQRFSDGHPAAVESLARWRHPKLGHVGPDEFIPIAEQTGLIGEIGAWVLQTACADLPALEAGYGHPLQLGINISAQQLRDPGLAASVAGALRVHGLSADRLYIEITETALLASDDTTIETVRALDAMGAHIALDDFGTGYSSLAILKRHPIKAIKIDRSFVDGITRNREDLAIVTALLGMARGLGLGTVAEGVETTAQYDLLRELGCDFAQGYLTGRPAPPVGRT
jgi:diguanylate cyclase (GGDEF)-like protein